MSSEEAASGFLSGRKAILPAAGLVALATGLLYLRSLGNGFVDWDDSVYVTGNPFIRSMNREFFRWAFFDFYSYNWHPLTWISHAADYAAWGPDPFGHHLTNLLLHAAITFLVFLLAARLMEIARGKAAGSGNGPSADDRAVPVGAAATALLFGLHPIHVESVAWIAERKDLLCALFFLLSIVCYLRHEGSRKSFGPYLFSIAFFILALMSKPMAVSLPLVLLVLDWFPLGRIGSFGTFCAALLRKAPFIALSALSSIVTITAQRSGHAVLDEIPWPTRALVAAKSPVAYLWKMAFPLDLRPFYPYPRDASLASPEYFGPIVLAIGITSACVYAAGKQKIWLSAWCCYVATLLPVLGILQVGGQSMADRYAYLPSLGPFMAAGVIAAQCFTWIGRDARRSRLAKPAGAVGAVVLVAAMSWLSYRQIGIWNSGIDLWTHVIGKEPGKIVFAYYSRGHSYSRAGRYLEAIQDYGMVISMNKGYAPAYVDRGLVYLKVNQPGFALADFRKACELGDPFGCNAARVVEGMRPGR